MQTDPAEDVFHDLNNNLVMIRGLAELPRRDPDLLLDSARLTHWIDLLMTSANDAVVLAGTLQDLMSPRS